jgi:hypothetical protein
MINESVIIFIAHLFILFFITHRYAHHYLIKPFISFNESTLDKKNCHEKMIFFSNSFMTAIFCLEPSVKSRLENVSL